MPQYLFLLVVYHDIVGFDVPVHDPHAVTVIQGLADTRTYVKHVGNHNNTMDSSQPGARVPCSQEDVLQPRHNKLAFPALTLDMMLAARLWISCPAAGTAAGIVFPAQEDDAKRCCPTWWQAQGSSLGSPVLPRPCSFSQKRMILT